VIVPAGQANGLNLPLNLVIDINDYGSMGSYIRVAQDNISSIARELSEKAQHDLRFSLVCYRDHPPAEQSYATRVFDFTNSLDAMVRNVGTMKAQGGGDTPESVACGLHAALKLPWRPNSVKVSSFNPHTYRNPVMLPPSNACWQLVVCISDAPPVRFLKSCAS
jgi:hypothetical protein